MWPDLAALATPELPSVKRPQRRRDQTPSLLRKARLEIFAQVGLAEVAAMKMIRLRNDIRRPVTEDKQG